LLFICLSALADPFGKRDARVHDPSTIVNFHYLFVNWDRCCRGTNSTYNIRIGRSREITGPYLDKDGKDLAQGGGTLFLGSDGPFIGPGHAGIFDEDGHFWFSCHFYDGTQRGASTLAIRPLRWTNGWPALDNP